MQKLYSLQIPFLGVWKNMPLFIQTALHQLAADNQPLGAELAFALCAPEFFLRHKPSSDLYNDCKTLFIRKYNQSGIQHFLNHIPVKQIKRPACTYTPLSPCCRTGRFKPPALRVPQIDNTIMNSLYSLLEWCTKHIATQPFSLDKIKLGQLRTDTKEVSCLLAAIFCEEEESVPANSGLDSAHDLFAQALRTKQIWTRPEAEKTARALGLFLDGAIEAINEWSFELFNEALIEDEGDLIIHTELYTQMQDLNG
jgi:hypothetical protein